MNDPPCTIERPPARAEESERAVIGAALGDPAAAIVVAALPPAFWDVSPDLAALQARAVGAGEGAGR